MDRGTNFKEKRQFWPGTQDKDRKGNEAIFDLF